MQITIQYFDDCPNWHDAASLVARYASEHADVEVEHLIIDSVEDAERLQFRGSPTLLVDGVDLFARGDEPVGLSCRVYNTPNGPAGAPTDEQRAAAITARRGNGELES